MVDILSPLTVDGKVRSKDVSTLDSTDSDDTLAPKGYVDSVSEKKLDTIGGLLTGPLTVEGGANINTSGHIEGTMLRTTADTHLAMAPSKYAVIDSSGWICHRTLDETKSDLGITGKQDKLEAGMNITIDGNMISAKNTTYEVATETSDGLMSSGDKSQLITLDSAISDHVNDTTNPHNVTKSQIGLGDVDNTSDLYKPISIAVQEALNRKADRSEISRIYRPCGSVATINDLPSDAQIGDVYDVAETGMNYAWVEIGGVAKWDSLGMLSDKIDMTNYYTREQVDSTVSGLRDDIGAKSTVSVTRSLTSGTKIGTITINGTDTHLYCNPPTTVDAALSSTSTNPVQNKVINTALLGKQNTLTAGSNISIDDNVISAVDTKYGVATQSDNGLMSSADKKKLDGIATGANKTTVDTALSNTSTNPVQNKVINTALLGKQNTLTAGSNISIDDNVISAVDTKYGVATQSDNGLMSSADKKKLDGIATGANKTTVDTALSNTSTNPVQNKVINTALAGKAGTSVATTSANGLMSSTDKSKLDGITEGADAVSFTRSLTSGTKVGTITINGAGTDIYCQTNTDTKVTQNNDTSTDAKLPILVSATADSTTARTGTVKYVNGKAYINPSTGLLTATKFKGPLEGNVTGNCSGSSGSCTGNSATATKAGQLTTARTIAISGGATGTATSFNGTANITIPVTALDVSKANAGTLAVARGGTGATNLANVTVGKATALNVSSTSAIAITAGVQFISTTILSQTGNWFIETHVSGTNIFQRATSMADPSNVCVRTSSNSGSSWNGWVFSYAVWK